MVGRCMPTVSSSIAKVWSVKDKHALQGPHSHDRARYTTISFERYTVSQSAKLFQFFSSCSLGSCVTFYENRVVIKLRTIRRNLWHADSKHTAKTSYRGRFRKREHGAWHAARFGHQMDRDQDLIPSRLRTFDFQHWNQSLQLGRDARGGWFVSGYVRLLQSQYESKSAPTVLKIKGQNLADYF